MKAFLVFTLVATLLSAGCVSEEMPSLPPSGSGNNTPIAMNETICKSAGGNWNECGSACRGAPAGTACTMQCVPMCECSGVAGFGCPSGYICTDYLPSDETPDAMGVCKLKTSE